MKDLVWELSLGLLGGLLLWTFTSQVDRNVLLEIDRSQMNRVTELYAHVANSVKGVSSTGESIDGLTKTIEALRVAVDNGRVGGVEAQGLGMKAVSMSARRLSSATTPFDITQATQNNSGGVFEALDAVDKTKIAEGDMAELKAVSFELLGGENWVEPKTAEEADKMAEDLQKLLASIVPPRNPATLDVMSDPTRTGNGFFKVGMSYNPEDHGTEYVPEDPKGKGKRKAFSPNDRVPLPRIPVTSDKGQRGKSMGRITLLTEVEDPKMLLRVRRPGGGYGSPEDESQDPIVLTSNGFVLHPRMAKAKVYYWNVDLDTMFGGSVNPQVAFMQGVVATEFWQETSIGAIHLGRSNFGQYGKFENMHNFITTHLQISETDKRAKPNGG